MKWNENEMEWNGIKWDTMEWDRLEFSGIKWDVTEDSEWKEEKQNKTGIGK